MTTTATHSPYSPGLTTASGHPKEARVLWALLAGNFVIGTGVMLIPGVLNELAASLQVTVAAAGQLFTAGAVTVCLGAPVLATVFAGWDRRRLLAVAMAWFAALHLASAFAPNWEALLVLRVLACGSAAVFTPQAAVVAGMLVAPERRGRAITTVFMGWSLASVLGTPLAAWAGGTYGWRPAFAVFAVFALLCGAWVWRAVPSGLRSPAIGAAQWRQTLASRWLLLTLCVTVLSATGQFTVFAYLSPYVAQVLGGSPADVAALFAVFGLCGVVGSFAVSRAIDRLGAAQAVLIALALMASSMLLWPLAGSVWLLAAACIPWGLGCFAGNSAQQVRLVALLPALASVSVALNTSFLYLGQGLGSALGGLMVAQGGVVGMKNLHWFGLAALLLAMALSLWVQHKVQRLPTPPATA